MNLLKKFKQYIQKENLFEPRHRLLVAISGGSDSMALLHLLLQCGYDIEVAHVNFNLRGSQSDADQELVKKICLQYNIPFHTTKFNTSEYIQTSGLGLQEAARNLRYTWFKELLTSSHLDYVLTAHHANDVAETIIFNLTRGAGINGLSGIKNNIDNIRRPLLFAGKDQILQYIDQHEILFREDLSNHKDVYKRNYIRHKIVPHLVNIQPSFIAQIPHFNQLLQMQSFYYQRALQLVIDMVLEKNDEFSIINLECLTKQSYPEQILFEILHTMNFNFIQCTQILISYKKNNTGALFLSTAYKAIINRHELIVKSKSTKKISINIPQFPYKFMHLDNELDFTLHSYTGFENFTDDVFYLNADHLVLPLKIRPVNYGDRFIPLGMNHRKKISDYLTDKKINRFSKENALVLVQKDEQIVAVLPYQISNNFKLLNGCSCVLKIQIKKADNQK